MKNNIIYDNEFTNRYLYLLENKELILSLCIDYGIEKEYYKNKILMFNASTLREKMEKPQWSSESCRMRKKLLNSKRDF